MPLQREIILSTSRLIKKNISNIARARLWLIPKEELASNRRVLLTCIDPRLLHSSYTVILKSLSGPEQFKLRQEAASLTTWADGRFAQQRYCQNSFWTTPVLFDTEGLPAHLAELWFSWWKRAQGFNGGCDPAPSPWAVPLRAVFFDTG